MRVIRRGVFETNSSSTHSITMCSQDEYDRWERGEVLLDTSWKSEKTFITKEEVIEKLKNNKYYADLDFDDEDEVNDAFYREEFYTSEKYFDDEYMENFESSYTTNSGEKIVAFGKYGRDG